MSKSTLPSHILQNRRVAGGGTAALVSLFWLSTHMGKLNLNSPDCSEGKVFSVLCVFQFYSCDLSGMEDGNDDAFFQKFKFEGVGELEVKMDLTPQMQKKPCNDVQKLNKF